MQIQRPSYLHGAQSISAPHRSPNSNAAGSTGYTREADQLDISPQATLASQLRDIPAVRTEKVAALRAQIASGTYETEDKLNSALSNLLNEIA